jgi:hypothetical protein
MWAIVSAGLKKFGGWIIAALSFLFMLLTIWHTSKKVGKAEGAADAAENRAADREAIAVRQINETREAAEREVETVKGASDVKDETSILDDAAVVDELRDTWSRD